MTIKLVCLSFLCCSCGVLLWEMATGMQAWKGCGEDIMTRQVRGDAGRVPTSVAKILVL